MSIAAFAASNPSTQFKVINKYSLEGGGRWDYLTVDPQAHRLYMSRTTHVAVIDTDSGKVVGDIPGTEGVHGIALATDLGVGFISDGGANQVTVFDLKTLKTLTSVPTGKNPDSILYHPGYSSCVRDEWRQQLRNRNRRQQEASCGYHSSRRKARVHHL